ncbi:MAG: NAD(P)-dependent oxidoreductase, partial [Candidatus Margulisbacteria bacterium]|nr:NAD(P)-dependent oxidoreductase [Candidatus Margulisiibacteriota bacterium]
NIIKNYILPNTKLYGLYHVSSNPITKYDLLALVSKIYKKDIEIEKDSDFICDRSLDSSRFRQLAAYQPPSWQKLVEKMYQHYNEFHYINLKEEVSQ